ncbi:extracellular solute-binding protein [Paenibacillus hunanensis]|uniref:Multiple sugar transport system substrate-binding protein n=1 Tax=Paenibacillus hunanensis TaxID=539262 RepID=A0ABU1J1J1_9BACL|nr:extracellular solute-binding protein [Paenibacillus hunanensis]MDR6244837.1 multiple sugar transport system substrate-binding protein [Paenibacillus hunanensis]GGJ04521.1 sugar ABC transporter substrate-binding protein [Paenibacillus hunanensis]
MKKQSYKWAAGMLLSLSVFTAACSSGGTATTGSADGGSASSGSKVVKVAYGKWNDTDVWGKWLADVKTEFEKENPGVTVELQPIQGAQYATKIPLLMSDPKTAPEVLAEDSFMINADSAAGYLEPLAVDQWSDWSKFNDGIKAAVKGKDDKSYGVPFSTDVRGLYYNKELFKKAGLPVPWQPKNWQDILTAAQTLKDKQPDIIPFWMNSSKAGQEATTMQTFEMLLYGTQNTLFENNKWVTQSPGVLSSLQFINDIYSKGLGPQLSQVMTAQAGQVLETDLMPNQKVGIVLNGSWLPSTWASTGSKPWPEALNVYDFVKMPTQNGQDPGYTSMSGGWTLAVGAKAQQKDLGWKFIQMAVNEKYNKEYAMLDSALTPRTDVAKDSEYLSQPGTLYAKAADFIKYTHVRPSNSDYPVVSTAIQQMVETVVTGGASPQDAMNQFSQSVQRSLGADKVAPAAN